MRPRPTSPSRCSRSRFTVMTSSTAGNLQELNYDFKDERKSRNHKIINVLDVKVGHEMLLKIFF